MFKLKNKTPFLQLPRVIKFKIFLYKIKTLYNKIDLKTFYSSDDRISSGVYGLSQLFTIGGDIYFYSPLPSSHQFRKVLGIYKKGDYIFMILQREDNLYEVQKDNFTFYNIFKSFDECKKFVEDF